MIDLLARDATRTSHLERSFIAQRRGMALLGAALPIACLVSSFLLGRTEFQTSISAYYWTLDPERNVLVGILCVVGVFLLLYKGYTRLEDWVLNAAGVSAAGIAFFPMDRDGDCAASGISAHGIFAVIFFGCILFTGMSMSLKSLEDVADPGRQSRFRWAYRLVLGFMSGCVVFAVVSRLLPRATAQWLCEASAIFWLEAFGVWAFSLFWYIKTRELDPSASWVPFR
jgi:hypothetical protein